MTEYNNPERHAEVRSLKIPLRPTSAETFPKYDLQHIGNAEWVAALLPEIPEGTSAAVCSKPGDPELGG